MSSILFLSDLSCQRQDRKLPVVQTRGKEMSSFELKSKVRMLEGVMEGMVLWRPCRREKLTPRFPGQWKKVCRRVSSSFALHLVQREDWFGNILDVRSAVGRMLWRSLKRKLVRLGPSIFCLDSCQVLSQDMDGVARSNSINCLIKLSTT